MKRDSAEDYLDGLLKSVSQKKKSYEDTELAQVSEEIARLTEYSEEEYNQYWEELMDAPDIDDEDFIGGLKIKSAPSRRVSKSEADFLMEFESELKKEAYDDYLMNLDEDQAIPRQKSEEIDIDGNDEVNSFSLGGVDLGELVSGVAGEQMVESKAIDFVPEMPVMDMPMEEPMEEPLSLEDFPIDIMANVASGESIPVSEEITEPVSQDDVFASLFGEADGAMPIENIDEIPLAGGSEGIDLGNLGEEDLMNLLAGEDGLSDIGDMLNQSESSEIPMDGLDAFAAFAEGEMSAQSADAVSEDKKKTGKDKKGGLLGKISSILKGLMGDDEEDDEIVLKKSVPPGAEALAGENADILASFDDLGEAPPKNKKDKKKKAKKEKKPKEKKEKKPKKPKEPKPKKEKKPKEIDNTPKLPRGPVLMIWVMVGSLFALVLLGTNLISYSSAISTAKSFHNNGEYAEAYKELLGLKIKEADMELYNQIATLATVDSELDAFSSFYAGERHSEALDSLICAAGRCELNADNADLFGCQGQMQILKAEVTNNLRDCYGMTYEEAIEMYNAKNREFYTIALKQKLKELGLE